MGAPSLPPGLFPPGVIDLMQRQVATYGRFGATDIIKVPELDSPLASPDQRPADPVRWTREGYVLSMYGSTSLATAVAAANLFMSIEYGSTEWLVYEGQAQGFSSFGSLFGDVQIWFPLFRWVEAGDTWTITYKNRAGGASLIPDVEFGFYDYVTIQRLMEKFERSQGSR